MSAILGIFDEDSIQEHGVVRSMLDEMRSRGNDVVEIWREHGAIVAVARAAWEMGSDFSDGTLVAHDDEAVVAADASLYYRDELKRALADRGVCTAGSSPSHLILAAYRAWGADCARYLEGDFAFLIWDRRRKHVVCSRDFEGKRSLYYGEVGKGLTVASTVSAILQHPDCPADLNLTSIAEIAAGLFAGSPDTCYRSIMTVPGAHTLEWQTGKGIRLARHWELPARHSGGSLSFPEAAEELRRILTRAVEERLASVGTTAVWLSGGWDSTAVFATGQHLVNNRSNRHLQAISVSYPSGDPGCEDDLIQATADHWSARVRWLEIDDIPLLKGSAARASERDQPFAHAYEVFNRVLARESRAQSARVAFDGSGGDQLFSASDVFLVDLFAAGRWRRMAKEWKAMGYPDGKRGQKVFLRQVVRPMLPWQLRRAIGILRGTPPVQAYFERSIPPWFNSHFVEKHDLIRRERAHTPLRTGKWADYEMEWFLMNAYSPRVFSSIFGFALEHGVELRSPLYDRRVVEFASTRPREERRYGREKKRLLRNAMIGLLPESVLAPRSQKTGLSTGYFTRSMREDFGELLSSVNDCLLLQELGVINSKTLRYYWDRYSRGGGNTNEHQLVFDASN